MSSHKQGVSQLANQVSISTKESKPSDNKIDTINNITGTFTTIATSAVAARVNHNQQNILKTPIERAISRLDTNNPIQQKMAQALREANLPDGIKGKLYPDAFVYNSEKTLTTKYKILSQDSVIGKKLARDLSKLVPSLKSMEAIDKKAGIVGIIAAPVIGSTQRLPNLIKMQLQQTKLQQVLLEV